MMYRTLRRRRWRAVVAVVALGSLGLGLPGEVQAGAVLHSDGFESGNLSAWTTTAKAGDGVVAAQSSVVRTGAYAAGLSASAPGAFAYARESLASGQTSLKMAGDVQVTAEGAAGSNVPLFRMFDPAGKRLVSVYRQNRDADRLWVQHSGAFHATSGRLPLRTWARLEVSVTTAGAGASTVEVVLNGVQALESTSANLGTAGIGAVQIGQDVASQAFGVAVDNVSVEAGGPSTTPSPTTPTTTTPTTTTPTTTPAAPLSTAPGDKLLIADLRNRRLLITTLDGKLVWKMDNPTNTGSIHQGPIGVRWLPNNQILATFGSGQVGVIDVATKQFVWQTSGYNGEPFQSPYEAELLPDGNVAVAMRFNDGGRVDVYNRKTGQLVWRHKISQAHAVFYRPASESYNSDLPTLLVGGWGATREVVYDPAHGHTGQTVAWEGQTEYTHTAVPVPGSNDIITVPGHYVERRTRAGVQVWKRWTQSPEEVRRVAFDPRGGQIWTGAEADRIEFRTDGGVLKYSWSKLSDGSTLDYPYGIQVINY